LRISIATWPSIGGPAAGKGSGLAQGLPGQGGDLARHAQDVGIAGDIGGDGNVEDGIAHVIHQGHPPGHLIQDDDAFVLFGDAQLFFRADHRVGLHAADLGPLEGGQHLAGLVPIVDARAFRA
jgi:hypothetical protein